MTPPSSSGTWRARPENREDDVTRPLPPTPSPKRRGGERQWRFAVSGRRRKFRLHSFCSPFPLRGGGRGEGLLYFLSAKGPTVMSAPRHTLSAHGIFVLAILLAPAVRAEGPRQPGVRAVAFSPDGKLLAASTGEPKEKGCVTVWDVT